MKCTLWVSLLLLASAASLGQAKKAPSKPDLTKFTSEQLKACFDDKSICGMESVYEISDELAKRLPQFSTDILVACLGDWKICGVENDIETGWVVSGEIARRGNPHKLLAHYWTEPDILIRDGIVHVAYKFKTPEVAEFMRKVLAMGKGDEDALYWPANYLAKKCDPEGLKWLSMREGRPEGCLLWAPTVALFGKCHYRPAIPYIVANSIRDACLNIDDEGVKDLQHFFPNSPRQFQSIEKMQDYYCDRARKEGFKVDCNTM